MLAAEPLSSYLEDRLRITTQALSQVSQVVKPLGWGEHVCPGAEEPRAEVRCPASLFFPAVEPEELGTCQALWPQTAGESSPDTSLSDRVSKVPSWHAGQDRSMR